MILGTKARYAVMAMVELAGREEGAPVKLADLAAAQEITLPYLEQIFSKLKQHGLILATRGPAGGYMLAKDASDIYIADIMQSVEESWKMTRCEKHGDAHAIGCLSNKSRCLTHDLWEGLESHIYQYLQNISLHDVRERKLSGKVQAAYAFAALSQ